MVYIGIVQGSQEQAKPLVIGKTTVYVHNNIVEKVDDEGNVIYEYEETQYTKDEYINKVLAEHELIKNALDTLIMEG